ncbi:MAG: hypothetical protein WC735_02455 [Candidatus Paceibacterota bacterium]|jgi:tRNA pseudouridine(55) synthase
MKNILLLNKKEGETPLEVLNSFRVKNKKYQNIKMTYAGRLDPMASGLLVVLVGEEVRNKEKYLALDKEYEFEILFGFSTDTYDILGKITHGLIRTNRRIVNRDDLEEKIKENLEFFIGKFIQKYPMYSSKTVAGKSLFVYARAGKVVESPRHEVNVESLKFLKLRKINAKNLLENIEKRIAKVHGPARNAKGIAFAGGDFRQEEILKIWRKKLQIHIKTGNKFFLVSFHIKCGSGTYVRSIANDLGQKMNIPALAFSIKRTKIGNWKQVG